PMPANDELGKEIQNPTNQIYWVYLDVWERNITWIEDDSIREKALNGPDTCARSKVVWQVKALTAADLNPKGVDPEVLNTRLSALEKELAQTVDPVEKEAIQQKIDGINAQLNGTANRAPVPLSCDGPLSTLIGLSGASMAAQVDPGSEIPDPCVTSPSA